jgi:hypothetical protein
MEMWFLRILGIGLAVAKSAPWSRLQWLVSGHSRRAALSAPDGFRLQGDASPTMRDA